MARMTLDKTRLIAGIWQGILQAGSPGAHPEIEVVHLEKAVPGVALHPVADQPGQCRVGAEARCQQGQDAGARSRGGTGAAPALFRACAICCPA